MEGRQDAGRPACFPRLYAAASLKPSLRHDPASHGGCFPRLYAAASLKRGSGCVGVMESRPLSAALCRGLIEAMTLSCTTWHSAGRFPRLYAAASLKPCSTRSPRDCRRALSAALCRGLIEAAAMVPSCIAWEIWLSAALCRGLIEAPKSYRKVLRLSPCFPRLYAAASLKHSHSFAHIVQGTPAFRGFMPRPH